MRVENGVNDEQMTVMTNPIQPMRSHRLDSVDYLNRMREDRAMSSNE